MASFHAIFVKHHDFCREKEKLNSSLDHGPGNTPNLLIQSTRANTEASSLFEQSLQTTATQAIFFCQSSVLPLSLHNFFRLLEPKYPALLPLKLIDVLPLHSVGWKLSLKKARQSHHSPYSCREYCKQDLKGPCIYLCTACAPSAYNCLSLQMLQCSSKAIFLPTLGLSFNWKEILIALQSIRSHLAFNNSDCNTIFDGK